MGSETASLRCAVHGFANFRSSFLSCFLLRIKSENSGGTARTAILEQDSHYSPLSLPLPLPRSKTLALILSTCIIDSSRHGVPVSVCSFLPCRIAGFSLRFAPLRLSFERVPLSFSTLEQRHCKIFKKYFYLCFVYFIFCVWPPTRRGYGKRRFRVLRLLWFLRFQKLDHFLFDFSSVRFSL